MKRWLATRWLRLLCIVFVLAGVFYRPILALAVWPLCQSDAQPDQQAGQPMDQLMGQLSGQLADGPEMKYLLFLRSARAARPAFPFAAEFVQRQPDRRVLVFRDYVRRAESIGAAPPFVANAITELVEHGIPRERIDVIGEGQAITSGEVVSEASTWLAQQDGDEQLLVVSNTFRTGYLHSVAGDGVPPDLRSRMHLVGFDVHGINSRTWWKNAAGLKLAIREWLRLVHLWTYGERRPNVDWDPAAYEASLKSPNLASSSKSASPSAAARSQDAVQVSP